MGVGGNEGAQRPVLQGGRWWDVHYQHLATEPHHCAQGQKLAESLALAWYLPWAT